LAQVPKRVLIVDDDVDICALISDVLVEDGFTVRYCLDGKRAIDILQEEGFDLVLADIKMPGLSGLELLRTLRDSDKSAQVILMTAYASLDTAIEALRHDAVDYLIKPFSLVDLRERVREILPDDAKAGQEVCYLDLCVDLVARRARLGTRELELTRQEFNLLAALFRQLGCTVPWETLLGEVWGHKEPQKEDMGKLRTCVRRLRQSLGDDARSPRYIVNRWGEGYRIGD
jgi:two-component system KDP operon response regulator KdpE